MSASNLVRTKATSLEDISMEEKKAIKRGKSRSLANIAELVKESGVFPREHVLRFRPESVPERAHSGQIVLQKEADNPLSSMNACVWMATSKYLISNQKSFTTALEIKGKATVRQITDYFTQHLADILANLQLAKPIEVLSFKLTQGNAKHQLLRVKDGPVILRLFHKTFPSPVMTQIFQWVVLDNIDTIQNVEAADIKDPEEGLQYFVPLERLTGRIDYDAVHYQIKEPSKTD